MKEIAWIFGRLGLLGFGGPVAVMALMEEEFSRKRRWVTSERFSEIYAVCKLLPGPVATQMAIYLGMVRGGTLGGFVAGGMFILPAFLLILAISFLYVNTKAVATAGPVFTGMQAGALVVIFVSLIQLARPYWRKVDARVIAVVSAILIFKLPHYEPLVILFFGVLGGVLAARRAKTNGAVVKPIEKSVHSWMPGFLTAGVFAGSAVPSSTLLNLFWVCFKAGAFVFGTGLAVVPMLEADSVRHYHWLTHSEFMDGLAAGQITPGPVTITATFIGYKIAGLIGALVATLGMYLPSFFNVLVLVPRVWNRFSGTPGAAGFSGWAIPAVVGGIFGTALRLGFLTLISPGPALIFVLAMGVALWLKPPAWLLIPACGVLAALGGLF